MQKKGSPVKRLIIEYCCDADSPIGDAKSMPEGTAVLRLTKDHDMRRKSSMQAVLKHIADATRKGIEVLLWSAIPCTGGSTLSFINEQRPGGHAKLQEHWKLYKALWRNFETLAYRVDQVGGRVAMEWPRGCRYWQEPKVRRLVSNLQMDEADFDGCAMGIKADNGARIKKPWRVVTNDVSIWRALQGRRCSGKHCHDKWGGSISTSTARYPRRMCRLIHQAWVKSTDKEDPVRTMRANAARQRMDEGSDVSAAAVLVPRMPKGEQSDTTHQMRRALEENAFICRSLDKKEALATPAAVAAMDVELGNLRKAGVWDESRVASWTDVANKARQSGKTVHVGRVFGIYVEKNVQFKPGDAARRFKGRIVFQGNDTRDQNRTLAFFDDCASAPAAMEAAKACDAYGLLPGHIIQQADAQQAYIQSDLGGNTETWIRLPREWWPDSWQGVHDPVVPLVKALYGHPRAGACWEGYCEQTLRAKGFTPINNWRSCYWHDKLKVYLTVYVDDFKLAGPRDAVRKGWELIRAGTRGVDAIELDEPSNLDKYLGCNHVEGSSKVGGNPKRTMRYDMSGFMQECVKVYQDCVATTSADARLRSLRPAATPFLEIDEDPDTDKEGVLAPHAAKVLMKILCAARMARYDLLRAVGALASRITVDKDL